jgi:hypothetical protein
LASSQSASWRSISNKKLRIHNTDIGNLISNLRGEVGEIIFAWVMMRNFLAQSTKLRTTDIQKDLDDPQLVMLNALADKLSDEIVARLAELAEQKVGRLTFYFAHLKLNKLEKETIEFSRFIDKNRFHEKRNYDISHKELPEKWMDHKPIYIPYSNIVQGIVLALRLMKKIDALHLGHARSIFGEKCVSVAIRSCIQQKRSICCYFIFGFPLKIEWQ